MIWNIKVVPVFALLIIMCYTFISVMLNKHNSNTMPAGHVKPDSCGVTSDQKVLYENGYNQLTNNDFLTFLKHHWIISPSEAPRSLSQRHKKEFSQVGQSLKVDKLLNHKKHGFFIECGAADGETLSNTLYLEMAYNWTGVLIEPNPDMFRRLLAKQRNAYLLNACLSTGNTTGQADFQLEGLYGGLSDTMQQQQPQATAIKTTPVQCFPLVSVLLALGNPTVDYFSLDVEGAELSILKTLPWDKVNINVIGIEYRVIHAKTKGILLGPTLNRLEELRQLFESTGVYKEVGILPNKGSSKEEKDKNGLDVFFQKV